MATDCLISGGLAGGIVGVIALGISWFLSPYLGKKGESLAQKEDFQRLFEQQKHATKELEAIRAEITENSWLRQRRWEIRHETYSNVLNVLWQQQAREGAQLAELKMLEESGPIPEPFNEFFQKIKREQLETARENEMAIFNALVMVSDEAKKVLRAYLDEMLKMARDEITQDNLKDHIERKQEVLTTTHALVSRIAWEEFDREA